MDLQPLYTCSKLQNMEFVTKKFGNYFVDYSYSSESTYIKCY
jgi:hypothetical protein